jgi:glycosyltransferase involved in cell wall biosynthesis
MKKKIIKIGVNGRFLTKPYTGIGQYTLNLLQEMGRGAGDVEFVVVVPEKVDLKLGRRVKIVVLPEPKRGSAGLRKTWWEQVAVPEFMQAENVDVAWFPYASNPWAKDWYEGKDAVKTVVSVHDCIPWMDKRYMRGMQSRLYHRMCRKSAKLAETVVTVSKASARDIVDACGVAARDVRVVANAASAVYGRKIAAKTRAGTLKRFKLGAQRYFLYVGGYDVRKNTTLLMQEYEELRAQLKADGMRVADMPKLVLVGGKQHGDKLYKSFDKGGKGVVKTGFLSEADLAALYSECLAFVNLSEKEGFNVPIVEAASCGAPLILSDIPVHREVAGRAAKFVKLGDEGAAKKAMLAFVKDGDSRGKFSEKSKKLSKKYSWEKSAREVLKVFASL